MKVLVNVSRGIIDEVKFFNDASMAIKALSAYVKGMNIEHDDAALYGPEGLIANARHFLDENDDYIENNALIDDISSEREEPIYIIGNPRHPLGFMVASTDDPLGYHDAVEAIHELGRMRQDFGSHLKLYRVVTVDGPLTTKAVLEKYSYDLEEGYFDYALVKAYID